VTGVPSSSTPTGTSGVPDHVTSFAPGRVNLIGEHTDYNQGLALPFAIAEGVTVRAAGLAQPRIEVTALDLGAEDSFPLDRPRRVRGWRAFVRGAASELQRAGAPLRGARLEISGTVPRGAGLSSSAALEVALLLALISLTGEPVPERTELAKLSSRVENEWVGARTGLLDQLASLYGEPDHALRIDFRSVDVQPVPLRLHEHRLVTVDSGEHHANAASGYNRRRAECARACELLGVDSLREVTLAMAEELPGPLDRRAIHVISENDRVELAVEALGRGDLDELGRLLDGSHASLREYYDVSTPAVEAAVRRLKQAGALGARIVGGGFGGHVLGLLPPGVEGPEGSLEVRPGAGARVVEER
jgi:galactokinase